MLKYIADMSCFIKYLVYDLCIDIHIYLYRYNVSVYLYALQTPYVLFARMNGKINWSMPSLFISLAPIGEGGCFSSCLKGFTGMVRELV